MHHFTAKVILAFLGIAPVILSHAQDEGETTDVYGVVIDVEALSAAESPEAGFKPAEGRTEAPGLSPTEREMIRRILGSDDMAARLRIIETYDHSAMVELLGDDLEKLAPELANFNRAKETNTILPLQHPAAPSTGFDPASVVDETDPSRGTPRIRVSRRIPSEEEAERILGQLDAVEIPIQNLSLRVTLQMLCEAAGMSYISPQDPHFDQSVTLKVRATPFEAIKALSDLYGFDTDYSAGIWRFYRVNINELITRHYELRYTSLTNVRVQAQSINATINRSNATAQGAEMPDDSSFSAEGGPIIKDLQAFLGLPTTGLEASIQDGGSVDNFARMLPPDLRSSLYQQIHDEQETVRGHLLFEPETNSIMVIATRQQHDYIEAYLEMVDRPQPLIQITSTFVETQRNPLSEFGIDWSGVSGFQLTATQLVAGPDATADLFREDNRDSGQSTGGTLAGGDASSTAGLGLDLNRSLASQNLLPANALLSASDMALQFNFIKSDADSDVVQEPTVVTMNNQPVAVNFTTDEPVVTGGGTVSSGVVARDSVTIQYIPIGTVINIFPQIVENAFYAGEAVEKAVKLNLAIVVSSNVGTRILEGNEYPVVANRRYTYSVVVPDGYTLAIGGLRQKSQALTTSKVPVLGSIPVLGRAFRSERTVEQDVNLIAYITPRILEEDSGHLHHGPVERLPSKEDFIEEIGMNER